MIENWIEEIKASAPPDELGMILVHHGLVRGTDKQGRKVAGMHLTYDREALKQIMADFERREGIVALRVWINEGYLKVGDEIMKVLVAGRFRTDVLPAFEELVRLIKTRVVSEREISPPNP